eukprot:10357176-Heterocapsa_arctica.AAC.1
MLKHEGRARALHQLWTSATSTAASMNANDRAPDAHDLKPGKLILLDFLEGSFLEGPHKDF